MKQQVVTTAALLATINLMISPHLLAQNPPASTYQPGFWQPVARVDIKRPVEIKLVNQTELILEYDLTANIRDEPTKILPGQTAVVKNFPIPAYFGIVPASSNPDSSRINLKYEVSADGNVVTVDIRQISDDIPGNRTLNLQETGAIYIY